MTTKVLFFIPVKMASAERRVMTILALDFPGFLAAGELAERTSKSLFGFVSSHSRFTGASRGKSKFLCVIAFQQF